MCVNASLFTRKLKLKRVLSVFLALIVVLAMLPISSWQVLAGNTVNIKLHFVNSASWSQVYVYAGEGDTSDWKLFTTSWPGERLSKGSDGYYTYEVTKSTSSRFNYIFNCGNDTGKTQDLFISAATLASDADGAIELWVDALGNV